jgi:hypothetical protein
MKIIACCNSEEYKRFAFAPEALLARRMYNVFRTGLHNEWEVIAAEAIIREWDELHPKDHAKIGEGYFNEDGTWRPLMDAMCS